MPASVTNPLIIGLPGPVLDEATRDLIDEVRPCGFILFARNIASVGQTRELTGALREASLGNPFICIDQEGGRVSRLQSLVGPTPSAADLGALNDPEATREAGHLTGQLLRMLGINWNFAPVLDIATKGDTPANSLAGRTFGNTPDKVIRHAGAWIEGLHEAGVLCCGKHFPGMGAAQTDPHKELPVVRRTIQELADWDLRPWKALASQLDAIMVSHVAYPEITGSKKPASLDPRICRELVADLNGFSGAILTDDLDMGAIGDSLEPQELARIAHDAGNHVLLFCHRSEAMRAAATAQSARSPWTLPAPHGPVDFDLEHFEGQAADLRSLQKRLRSD